MLSLIRQLVRPYRGMLCIILTAMMIGTAMGLASPYCGRSKPVSSMDC
jgi:hypothetical protein